MNASSPSDRIDRIQRLFDAVVDLDLGARAAYLDRTCSEPVLRREVESLLEAYDANAAEVRDVLEQLLLTPPPDLEEPSESVQADPYGHVGRNISHYRIEEKLGGGGMGVVYKARDTRLERTVALKFLPPHLSMEEEAKARFTQEAKAASALDHPNICTIYDIDQTREGQLFIAMACYEGETLKKKIARGPLPVEEALGYAVQIARGLAQAHEVGIVHRDVKPANVMLTRRGVVKIVDFGIAKVKARAQMTRTGSTVGTVRYMSPEQVQGAAVDHRTDLWSLGVVLYEMLTGEQPFQGECDQAVIYAILNEKPEPLTARCPEAPPAVAQIVERALQKDVAARYGQMGEMLLDLQVLQERPASGTLKARLRRAARSRRRPVWLYGSVALVLLVLLLFVSQPFLATGPGKSIRSIAVLPMVNRTGDPDQEHITDGMTDLLINNLSRLSGLDRVISHMTTRRYKHTDKSLQEIGRELGVDVLVEASVLSNREQVLVSVNLIEAETERILWGATYERAIRDLLKLERDMALAIVREMQVQLMPQDQASLVKEREVDPEALHLYFKGIQARDEGSPTDHQQEIAYFEQAIAIDPGFALAYAGLAIEYALHTFRDPEVKGKAKQLAEEALLLDPFQSEPYIAIGVVREWIDWDWSGAEEAFRRAIELNPGDALAHHELGQLWMRMAKSGEALAMEQRALFLNPLSARFQSGIGEVYLYSGRYDEAIAAFNKALALDPDYAVPFLGSAYLHKGMYTEFFVSQGADPEEAEKDPVYSASMGRHERALQWIEFWETEWVRGAAPEWIPWKAAQIHTALGENTQAIAWLERAYEAHWSFLVYIKVDPHFYSLHAEPRFQALLEKMGLAD